jgi:hypothetical protein
MRGLTYVYEPVPVPNSDLMIVGISESDGAAYALRNRDVTMHPPHDLENCFPLMSHLVRKAESGGDVPDYDDVEDAIQEAKEWIRQQKERKG